MSCVHICLLRQHIFCAFSVIYTIVIVCTNFGFHRCQGTFMTILCACRAAMELPVVDGVVGLAPPAPPGASLAEPPPSSGAPTAPAPEGEATGDLNNSIKQVEAPDWLYSQQPVSEAARVQRLLVLAFKGCTLVQVAGHPQFTHTNAPHKCPFAIYLVGTHNCSPACTQDLALCAYKHTSSAECPSPCVLVIYVNLSMHLP